MTQIPPGAFARPGTSLEFRTGTWRVQRPVHVHRAAPCHTACPAGEDAQAYLARVETGDLQGAWETLISANPLPAITGRVCPHPCEAACNRGQYDEAVSIHGVERFLGDEALRRDWAYPVTAPGAGAPSVAVVGAGPAGLSAAYHLLRGGCRVTLYEAMAAVGGTVRTAIPRYRLPAEVLEAETARLLALPGLDFRPHTRLGRDVSLEELTREHAALFLAPGRRKGREWNADFAVPGDLHTGLHLLETWVAEGTLPDQPDSVAIVGGGNTAVDLARVLRRQGVPSVHLITHQRIPAAGVPAEDAMRAAYREVAQAVEEGVILHEHRGVRRLILRGERVVGMELVHMKKLPDADGRLRRVAFEGTETVLHVDHVIPAIGQEVDPLGFEALVDRGQIPVEPGWGQVRGQTHVFAGGDARGDHGTVTEAVGDGRRAARGILAILEGETLAPQHPLDPVPFSDLNLHYFEPAPAAREPVLPPQQRQGLEEIEGGLDAHGVRHEAHRCLSCGDCLACDNCWTLCPDQSVLKTREQAADGSHYVFDYDYCKGCGICAQECPTGYIRMESG
ncbi:MAG: FAD-dependent oxidoreductase [Ectothiorhodospira sp.]